MTRISVLTLIITITAGFALGWFLHRPASEAAIPPATLPANTQQIVEPDIVTLADTPAIRNNTSQKIKGKFILDGTHCAGYNFISDVLVSRTSEADCRHPDTFRLEWINPTVFYLRDMKPGKGNYPPRVWIYSVKFYDGKRLMLRWYNTLWAEGKDEDESFHRE